MRSRIALVGLLLLSGCGSDSSDSEATCGSSAPVPVRECATGFLGFEVDTTESAEELARDRVGREKGLVPGCFMLAAETFSCTYVESENQTHCTMGPFAVTPERKFTMVWHDQDCDTYDGELYLDATGSRPRQLVARLTPIEPGSFFAEAVDDFDFGVPFSGGPGTGVSRVTALLESGLCHVNLEPRPDAEGVSSSVGLCAEM